MRLPAPRSCSARPRPTGRKIDLKTAFGARARRSHRRAQARATSALQSLRGGTVAGEHQVIFAGPAERIVLAHKAEDRMIFARGALKAALWARGREPGLYSCSMCWD